MLQKLLDAIDKSNNSNINKDFIIKAYNFAYEAHKDQKRESGEPYIIHPVEVACILCDLGLDSNTIAAGLLHDVIEDTQYTFDDLAKEFNQEVAYLVEGVTKLEKIKYKTLEERQADNVRKMLMAMTKDIRVILIKLADRLHNMRTLKYMPIEKQKEKSKETLNIYAPLAHRLGISRIKWELEDLSFRYLKPDDYYYLVKKIAEKRVEREEYISQIKTQLSENLEKANIKAEIDGRPKHFYSIYRKMVKKNKSLEQIFDLTAVRILVNTVKDCYAALGIAHTIYKPMPGRFKDYIAMPKPNMYQSLHSTVLGPQGKPFEIQIRTYEMHKTAEYGIAAHWKYKEGIQGSSKDDKYDVKLPWIGEILEWQKETSNAEEFVHNFKIDLFADEVFVFTPKGKVINLPNESTPIDFAYKIHTDIGNKCVGAKVNGKMVPLDYKLKTGEIVEVLTSSASKGPSIDWLNVAKSNQAKSKIRSWFKKTKREENVSKGKEIVEKEAKRQGFNFGEIAKGRGLEHIFRKYNLNNIDDIYAAVSLGVLSASNIIIRLKEWYIKENGESTDVSLKAVEEKNKLNKTGSLSESNSSVVVQGISNALVRFAKCCNPVPGDEIVGYITKGRGVSIHRKDCKNVNKLIEDSRNKIIGVYWGDAKKSSYIAEIEVKADDRNGLLSDIMEIIAQSKTSIDSISAKTVKENIGLVNMKIKINDINQLKEIMKQIKNVKGVMEVYRKKY